MESLLALREAARVCRDEKYRERMKVAADSLHVAIDLFYRNPKALHLGDVNGAWVHAQWLYDRRPKDDPPGGSGVSETRLAA